MLGVFPCVMPAYIEPTKSANPLLRGLQLSGQCSCCLSQRPAGGIRPIMGLLVCLSNGFCQRAHGSFRRERSSPLDSYSRCNPQRTNSFRDSSDAIFQTIYIRLIENRIETIKTYELIDAGRISSLN